MILEITFAFAVTAHGLDLGTTMNCIGAGTCREANHLLARFKNPIAFSAAKMGVASASEIGIYKLSQNHRKLAIIANLAIGSAFTAVAVHNYNKSNVH